MENKILVTGGHGLVGSEFIGVVSELTTNKITSGKVVNLSSE